jgi:predicted transcriptional regulator
MSYFGTIYAEDISHRAKVVYMYLRDRTNASGTCWPGIKTIAKDLHLSRSTVQRALDDLTRCGFIKKKPRYRDNGSSSSNLYTVVGL